MIFCRTTIGFGSPNKSGTADVHGSPLGEEEIEKTRKALEWNFPAFEVPKDVYEFWNSKETGRLKNTKWEDLINNYNEKYPNEGLELKRRIEGRLPEGFQKTYDNFLNDCNTDNSPMATRKASKVCLDFFSTPVA